VYCYSTPPHCDLDRFDGGFHGTVPGLQPDLNTRCTCWSDLGQGPAGPFDIRIGGHDHAYRAVVSPECMADWKSDFSHDLGGWLPVFSLPARIFSPKLGARISALFTLVSVGLCRAAAPSSAGGPDPSMPSDIGPALPLLAVLSGRCAEWLTGRRLILLGVALLPQSADAARRSWTFGRFPYASPRPYTWTSWRYNDTQSLFHLG